MTEDLEKQFQLQSGKFNFSKFLNALDLLNETDSAFAMPVIAAAANAYDDLLNAHSGLGSDEKEVACGALVISLINATSKDSAKPVYEKEVN